MEFVCENCNGLGYHVNGIYHKNCENCEGSGQVDFIKYKGYFIKENDYPHPEYKYEYYHEDDTDGFVNFCKTIDECKQEIDDIIEQYNFF